MSRSDTTAALERRSRRTRSTISLGQPGQIERGRQEVGRLGERLRLLAALLGLRLPDLLLLGDVDGHAERRRLAGVPDHLLVDEELANLTRPRAKLHPRSRGCARPARSTPCIVSRRSARNPEAELGLGVAEHLPFAALVAVADGGVVQRRQRRRPSRKPHDGHRQRVGVASGAEPPLALPEGVFRARAVGDVGEGGVAMMQVVGRRWS